MKSAPARCPAPRMDISTQGEMPGGEQSPGETTAVRLIIGQSVKSRCPSTTDRGDTRGGLA